MAAGARSFEKWQYVVGVTPFRVVVFEDLSRKGVATLRWYGDREDGTRGRTLRALGYGVRGPRGGIDPVLRGRAEAAAEDLHHDLISGKPLRVLQDETATMAKGGRKRAGKLTPLTIMEGWTEAKDPDHGRWNTETPHRKELERAIRRAVQVWGAGMTWDQVGKPEIRTLWRRELKRLKATGADGVAGTRRIVTLVMAVAAWLRDEELIAPTACVGWRRLKIEMAADTGNYTPHRPRYTLAEYRLLFAKAWLVDVRHGLLYNLGAEARAGQVIRCKRSALSLEKGGHLDVQGRGRKGGLRIRFTKGQLSAVKDILARGYLRRMEQAYLAGEIKDYPLFPGGRLVVDKAGGELVAPLSAATGGHVWMSAVRKWHRGAERLAGIPHMPGRGLYGARRIGVDGAKENNASREGLKSFGGWGSEKTPDDIYADQEQEYAQFEARDIRAKVRGEDVGGRSGNPAGGPPQTSQKSAAVKAERRASKLKKSSHFVAARIAKKSTSTTGENNEPT